MSSEIKYYTPEIEEIFLNFFVTDPELFVRCLGIVEPEHYRDSANKKAVTFLLEHANEYSTLPTIEQIKAMTTKELEKIDDINDNHKDWLLNEYEQFARHRQSENVIYEAPDLVEEGRYGELVSKMKEAVEVSLVKDLGTDYFQDPAARLQAILDSGGATSTGYKAIDDKLYGGLNRGEITIFAGQSGAGKSLFLQNFAINWAEMGLNVVYLSLELSEQLCAMRLDAMISSYTTKDVMRNKDDVGLRVSMFQKKNKGTLRIKQLKNGCTANDIKGFIKEYEIQTGIKVDAVLLDYLDLCNPTNAKISLNEMFLKDKYVTENMRDLAVELNMLFVTASQLNRGSHEEMEFGHQHIAGGLSKINTADNVIGIFTTNTMRENGRYQIQFMKTRSSSGVGQKGDLGFNPRSLRIYDIDDDDPLGPGGSTSVETSSVVKKLQESGALSEGKNTVAPPNNVLNRSAALRNLMQKYDD